MNFAFSEEEQMFQDAVHGMVHSSVDPQKIRDWSESGNFGEFDQFLTEAGLAGIGVSESDSGQGGGIVEQMILLSEFGKAAAPTDRLLSSMVVCRLLAEVGKTDQTLHDFLEGKNIIAYSGSAGQPLDKGAELTLADGLLTGTVPLVMSAAGSHQLLVPVADGKDVNLAIVDTAAASITTRRLVDQSRLYSDITFESVPVLELGRISAQKNTNVAANMALLVAAESLGLAEAMLDMTVEYVKQRVQFDVPVGSFQAVKHSAAEAAVEIEAARSGVYYAAWALQNNAEDGPLNAWIAKSYATQVGVDTAERALKLHGAIGYTWEHDLQIYYKRARSNLVLFGGPRGYLERVADIVAPSNQS